MDRQSTGTGKRLGDRRSAGRLVRNERLDDQTARWSLPGVRRSDTPSLHGAPSRRGHQDDDPVQQPQGSQIDGRQQFWLERCSHCHGHL